MVTSFPAGDNKVIPTRLTNVRVRVRVNHVVAVVMCSAVLGLNETRDRSDSGPESEISEHTLTWLTVS